jgi:hypothetical protein
MKVLAFVQDASPGANADEAIMNVNFMTSDGQLTSNIAATVTITDTENAIASDLKQQVADAVNAALGTTITKLAVRLF